MMTVPVPDGAGKKYLWLPVYREGEEKRLRLYDGEGRLFYESVLVPGEGEPWFTAAVELSEHAGETVKAEIDAPAGWPVSVREKRPPAPACRRPQLHFAPESGWMNDPNGLLYQDGHWHMFFQHNPFGAAWGNMHWGHAVSADLLRWTQLDEGLSPDETGTMYSGSGIRDREGLLGYGKDAAAFFYTAAGGNGDWSAGVPFTQRIAVRPAGTDWSGALRKTGITAVPFLAEGNRDPKVFFHPESGAYIMALYLEGNDFGLFRSRDLRNWEMSQRLTLEKAWECPDLFPLRVNEMGEKKWVFWAADGYYFIGDFDGFRFTPETGRLDAYAGGKRPDGVRIPYAAQTFSGLESGRIVSVAWLRLANCGKPYTGVMSVPMELRLVRTPDGLRLRMPVCSEVNRRRRVLGKVYFSGRESLLWEEDRAFQLRFVLSAGASGRVRALGMELEIRLAEKALYFCGERVALPGWTSSLGLELLFDEDVVELRAADDTVWGAWSCNPPSLAGEILLESSAGAWAELSAFVGGMR